MTQISSTTPKTRAKIGIIDDDPIIAAFMKKLLNRNFADCSVEILNEPKAPPMLDIYFVDNEFDGTPMATQLLTEIRRVNPDAMVVAMSASLDQKTLRDLMNGGCNAVYDKNHPEDSSAVFEVVQNYLQALEACKGSRNSRAPFAGTVSSIQALLREWNQRLSTANQ